MEISILGGFIVSDSACHEIPLSRQHAKLDGGGLWSGATTLSFITADKCRAPR
jgi:hypothetical protein